MFTYSGLDLTRVFSYLNHKNNRISKALIIQKFVGYLLVSLIKQCFKLTIKKPDVIYFGFKIIFSDQRTERNGKLKKFSL